MALARLLGDGIVVNDVPDFWAMACENVDGGYSVY